MRGSSDAHALFLSRAVWRCRQQRLWPQGIRVPAAQRCAVYARAYFRRVSAPRGQLPYIVDDGEAVGDSDTIIAFVTAKYRLSMDSALTTVQRDMSHLVTRMLDDLYWVMSYS